MHRTITDLHILQARCFRPRNPNPPPGRTHHFKAIDFDMAGTDPHQRVIDKTAGRINLVITGGRFAAGQRVLAIKHRRFTWVGQEPNRAINSTRIVN